jgi:hypothetical protein
MLTKMTGSFVNTPRMLTKLPVIFVNILLWGCSGISISGDFEGGSIGSVTRVGENHYECRVPGQADQDGRNRQVTWYAFRLDGAKGREVTITLTDLAGEYDYKPGAIGITGDAPPLVSVDGRVWRHLPSMNFDREKAACTFKVTPEADRIWIAHIEPYPVSRLEDFLGSVRGHPDLREETIGKSVEGRILRLLTISAPGPADRPAVWLMCRQHAWESGTSFVGEGAVRWLLSEEARPCREKLVFKVLPMMDPDGCARGGVRFNLNGYDVNRNWDTADPEDPESRRLMPEICAAKKVLLASRVDLFLTLHNQETGGWLSGSERHRALADRFFARLREKTLFFTPNEGPRPPGARPARGRYSVHQYLDLERGFPAFILEQGIARDGKLGRLPVADDRRQFGRQLARVMCDLVLEK